MKLEAATAVATLTTTAVAGALSDAAIATSTWHKRHTQQQQQEQASKHACLQDCRCDRIRGNFGCNCNQSCRGNGRTKNPACWPACLPEPAAVCATYFTYLLQWPHLSAPAAVFEMFPLLLLL
jgi:hypothetical protein